VSTSLSWWSGLDLRVLRHVRAVLRHRGLELSLVDRPPATSLAFAPLDRAAPQRGGLAVAAGPLNAISAEEASIIQHIVAEAAIDVAAALRDRGLLRGPSQPAGAPPRPRRAGYDAIIGEGPTMQALFALLDRIATSESAVLIGGENGTGKELVARAIHEGSPRRDRRFVVTNCSAFNDNLLDSELFGHKRGAFTGAVGDKPGLFEQADLGTFFLDEIGDMSPALQVKVLRVLQDGTFNRVGDTETRKVDVRIITATNRDLGAMIQTGQFREDLYYRINVLGVVLPPLRGRREDIPVLIRHFLGRHHRGAAQLKRLAPACEAAMLGYGWPGNVRELENEVERLVVLAGDAVEIPADLLSTRIRNHVAEPAAVSDDPASLPAAVEALERRMIDAAMRRHRGNKTRVAAELKVSRRNLIRLVAKYQLGSARALE
jgi:transcriptional regulator with PAS, ATPase and Fis domain